MYEITEDTASSWPVPTDVSLYPSGGTGLELPDRKGKGSSEGMVGVCPCCESSVSASELQPSSLMLRHPHTTFPAAP